MAELKGASMKESSIDDLAKFESCRSKQVLQRHKGLHRECEKMIQQFLKEARFETSRLARIQTRYKEKIKVFEKAEAVSPSRSVSTLSGNSSIFSKNSTVPHRESIVNLSTTNSQGVYMKQKDNVTNLPTMMLKNDATKHLQTIKNTSENTVNSYKSGGISNSSRLHIAQGMLPHGTNTTHFNRISRNNSISQSLPGNIGSERPASLTRYGQTGNVGMSAIYPRSSTRNSHWRHPQKKHKRQLLFRIEKIDGKITYYKETKPPDPLEKTFETNKGLS